MPEPDEVPLTREALAHLLDRARVPGNTYHLYGAHLNDAFVMDHRPEGWVVFYSERGGEWSLRAHASEDLACHDLLVRLIRSVES